MVYTEWCENALVKWAATVEEHAFQNVFLLTSSIGVTMS